MDIIQALILSLIQGITEFLPISSSGHLIIIPKFLNWQDQGLAFDAVVHLGTAAAAIVYFREYIFDVLKGFVPRKFLSQKEKSPSPAIQKRSRRFSYVILVSMVPAVIVGLLFKTIIANQLRSVTFVALNLLAWGIVLILAEVYANRNQKHQPLAQITYLKGFTIGLAQALALFPGTSRSGITISAALFSDLSRKDAVRFSFLMSIPVILGAGILSLFELLQNAGQTDLQILPIMLGLLGAFISGLIAIHFLLNLIDKKGLLYFGVYRVILAIVLLVAFV